MVNAAAPFKPGDKVLCDEWITGIRQEGEVVDVLIYPGSPNEAWIVFVNHGDYEYAYAHNEVTLVRTEPTRVIYVDFKKRKRIKNPFKS